MKILFVNAHIGKGGGQAIQTSAIIRELSKKHKVKLLTLKHHLDLVEPPCEIEYAGKFRFPIGLFSLYRKMKLIEDEFDVVFALDAYFSLPVVSLSKKPKFIRLGMNPIEDLKLKKKRIISFLYKPLFNHSLKKYSGIIFNSKNLKDKFGQFNSYYVKNGYNIKKFNPESKISSRRRFFLPENKIILLYTGKIIQTKNVEAIFKSLSKLDDDFFLVLVGNKNEENFGDNYYRKLITKYSNVMDRVKFVDEVSNDEIPYYLNAADIFVFPSLFEGSPSSVLEAMGSGLPVICSDIPPHRELIKHNKSGLLFNNGKDMTIHLNHLKRDKKFMKKLGNNAKKFVKANHDIKNTGDNYLKIIQHELKKMKR